MINAITSCIYLIQSQSMNTGCLDIKLYSNINNVKIEIDII